MSVLLLAGCGRPHPTAAPKPVPTPIGLGPEFRPPPGVVGPCRPGPLHGRHRAHVEIFLRRRVVIIPAGIGLGRPWRERLGRIESARCRAVARTLDPTGVVEFDGDELTADAFFSTWGRDPLPPRPVRIYVNGAPAPEGEVVIHDGDEVVFESGGYVRPHASFLFPPR